MSGKCDQCEKLFLDCQCYERCKCGKHPATHEDDFEMLFSEFGSLDKVLWKEIDATCKTCGDKFKFKKEF